MNVTAHVTHHADKSNIQDHVAEYARNVSSTSGPAHGKNTKESTPVQRKKLQEKKRTERKN
jgi:hypothetical protein